MQMPDDTAPAQIEVDDTQVADQTDAAPEGDADTPERTITLRALGQTVELQVTGDTFLTEDSQWRLHHIYQRYLASHLLPLSGTMLDIGAGFGALTVPFAHLFPDWTVWAFEPDPDAFAALATNTADLPNVHAVNAAVRGGLASTDALDIAVQAADPQALVAAALSTVFRQSEDKAGFIETAEVDDAPRPGMRERDFATIPAAALSYLAPTALKMVAPGAEQGILTDLGSPPDHTFGEMWHPVRSQTLIHAQAPKAQVHLPLAGTPLVLRKGQAIPDKHAPGLDVVIACYNSEEFIVDCVGSVLDDACPEIRAVVVDDGSTDDSARMVRDAFGEDPRVTLLSKPNGGCASARNYGRQHSDAAHVTFVDADDMAEPGFYAKLLELGRYSGSEVTQGAFKTFETGADPKPSYETETLSHIGRIPFGSDRYFVAPSHLLIQGQPAIWRRIYRRDFLDAKSIWFPEHIRAFDDQIFQLLTLQLSRDVYCRDDTAYLYRQHPGQDIKAGDERWFYSLEMFRLVIKRAIAEGWNDLVPVIQSYVNTVNWIHKGLREDLKPHFLAGAGELWVYIEMALGRAAFGPVSEEHVAAWDFQYHAEKTRKRLEGLDASHAWIHLDASALHPAIMRSLS